MTDFTLTITSVVLVFFIVLIVFWNANPKDDTDPADGRSGLSLYTDHKTGLQYLGARGGLTPRLDRDGNHMAVQP